MAGGVVSSAIESLTGADQFPAASENFTDTVFVPSPVESVQLLLVAYGSAAEYVVPSLENRISATTP